MSFRARKPTSTATTSPLERSARLVVISDTLAQPATLLFRHLLAQSTASGRALLVCFEHAPATLLHALGGAERVAVVDVSAPVGRFRPRRMDGRIDAGDEAGVRAAVLQLIAATVRLQNMGRLTSQPTADIFIDSANAFADAHSPFGLVRLLEAILAAMKRASLSQDRPDAAASARLTIVHHVDWPPFPSTGLSSPDLRALLLSPSLSPSLLHLSINPSGLVEHLASAYGIMPDDARHRTHSFLQRFQQRGWGGSACPTARDASEAERSIMLDALGDGRYGRCVLEWMVRGATSVGGARASAKVERGIEGLRYTAGALQVVPLNQAIDRKLMQPRSSDVAEPEVRQRGVGIAEAVARSDPWPLLQPRTHRCASHGSEGGRPALRRAGGRRGGHLRAGLGRRSRLGRSGRRLTYGPALSFLVLCARSSRVSRAAGGDSARGAVDARELVRSSSRPVPSVSPPGSAPAARPRELARRLRRPRDIDP